MMIRRLFAFMALALMLGQPARADEAQALATGLQAAAGKDWPAAQAVTGGVGGVVIEWLRLRAGDGKLGEYEAFIATHPDWPGIPFLREKGEVAVARSTDPARVIAYFGNGKPKTATGALALIKALSAAGRAADAEAEAFRAWTDLRFTEEQETDLLALQGPALKVAHEVRLDRLLWDGERSGEARRMLPRVSKDWQALAAARLGLQSDTAGVTALVAAVPTSLAKDPGLAHARFIWRMRKDRYPDAATLILERSTSAASLGDPSAWAERRASLARIMMRQGAPQTAYDIATRHWLTAGADYADLEFLSGFLALRKLGEPAKALVHFQNLQKAVVTPISLARAAYWVARAREALGDAAAAENSYAEAARYQTTYYGLLAAEKLGLSLDSSLLSYPAPPSWTSAAFAGSSVLQAAILLSKAGDRALSKRFFLHLAENLTDTELAQLADLALSLNEPHIALLIAKSAAERGLILPGAYFPVTAMVPDGLPVSRALALAIARRESEFDPRAQSPVGARGLMQVMPATAEIVSKRLGLAYGVGKLTADPAYNVTLGAQYLAEMIETFGPSIALIASGYNAGPRRPAQWIDAFGDPRMPQVDVVDWVETIPFAETRTYVMRVVEGVVIYRAKLKGAAGPVKITAELKG